MAQHPKKSFERFIDSEFDKKQIRTIANVIEVIEQRTKIAISSYREAKIITDEKNGEEPNKIKTQNVVFWSYIPLYTDLFQELINTAIETTSRYILQKNKGPVNNIILKVLDIGAGPGFKQFAIQAALLRFKKILFEYTGVEVDDFFFKKTAEETFHINNENVVQMNVLTNPDFWYKVRTSDILYCYDIFCGNMRNIDEEKKELIKHEIEQWFVKLKKEMKDGAILIYVDEAFMHSSPPLSRQTLNKLEGKDFKKIRPFVYQKGHFPKVKT